VKERPILFRGEMVRAILEGRKTQTRRIVKLPIKDGNGDNRFVFVDSTGVHRFIHCPYGEIGMILWVRETWGIGTRPCPFRGDYSGIEYRADESYLDGEYDLLSCCPFSDDDWIKYGEQIERYQNKSGWKPSIFMPRWASRITLEITDVRVERLNDISDDDCEKEGLKKLQGGVRIAYKTLWESINGSGSWDLNPWVWVVEFKKL